MDSILIRDLSVDCTIGVNPVERRELQRVRINIEMHCDLSAAGASDDLADTPDYTHVRDRVSELAVGGRFKLVERLAQCIAETCLDFPGVHAVGVTVDKPGALSGARSVAVRIERGRSASADAATASGV